MLKRTYSVLDIEEALSMSPVPIKGFCMEEWRDLSSDNICLTDGRNYCLFEPDSGSYYGHWFCKDRGKAIKAFIKEVGDYMFCITPSIKGLTPIGNRAALWMARHIGFTGYGNLTVQGEEMQLFILTRDEWKRKHN